MSSSTAEACIEQSNCIQFAMESIIHNSATTASTCSHSCSYRICMNIDYKSNTCTRRNNNSTFQYSCSKNEEFFDDCTMNNTTGFSTSIQTFNVHSDLCQVVPPGDYAEFMLYDGISCKSSTASLFVLGNDTNNGHVTANCKERANDVLSCSRNHETECVWTVQAPDNCPVPTGTTTTAATHATKTFIDSTAATTDTLNTSRKVQAFVFPTKRPRRPTVKPTKRPVGTREPTKVPSKFPTKIPSRIPTQTPSNIPTKPVTNIPTKPNTKVPTKIPSSRFPTKTPTEIPTNKPNTMVPTKIPTKAPTRHPTRMPSKKPTKHPTTFIFPTRRPQRMPTTKPIPKLMMMMKMYFK